MKILVTGGSGFIGTNYIESLIRTQEADFINIDSNPPRNKQHNKYWKKCNILDKSRLESIIKGFEPTHLVHLAAKCGLSDDLSDYSANIEGVHNLLNALDVLSSIKRVIFTSSLLVCEPGYIPENDTDYKPYTVYGESKMHMEKIIRSKNELPYEWTIIRPISIWGPWFVEPFTNFFKAIKQGWYFHIGKGHCLRTFGYVENTVYQIQKLLIVSKEKVNKKTIYVSDEPPIDLRDFADKIGKAINGKKVKQMPLWVAKIFAKMGDMFKILGWSKVPLTTFRLKNMQTELIYTDLLSPIIEIANPLPYDIEEGVNRTVKWMKETGRI